MRSFNGFDIQIHDSCGAVSQMQHSMERNRAKKTFMFTDSCISGIRQWTRLTIAQASDVVLVPAKVLGDGSNKNAIRARNFGVTNSLT